MNEKELQLILKEGEEYNIEFKESLNNLDKEMVAFANSSGGRIFLGIRRNHIIADLFSKIHFGEKMGTGFDRMGEICKKDNSPFPEIGFNENYFYITFMQSHEYLSLGREDTTQDTTQKTTQKILRAIEENSAI